MKIYFVGIILICAFYSRLAQNEGGNLEKIIEQNNVQPNDQVQNDQKITNEERTQEMVETPKENIPAENVKTIVPNEVDTQAKEEILTTPEKFLNENDEEIESTNAEIGTENKSLEMKEKDEEPPNPDQQILPKVPIEDPLSNEEDADSENEGSAEAIGDSETEEEPSKDSENEEPEEVDSDSGTSQEPSNDSVNEGPVEADNDSEKVEEPSNDSGNETSSGENADTGIDDPSEENEEAQESKMEKPTQEKNKNDCIKTAETCDGCCMLDNYSAESTGDEVEPSNLIWHRDFFAPRYRMLKLGCCKYSWYERRRCCHYNPWFQCCHNHSYYTPRPWGYWKYHHLRHPYSSLRYPYPYYR